MKKSYFLLISSLFLLASCGPTQPEQPDIQPCPDGQHVDADQDGYCDVCGMLYPWKHATQISATPNAPFYLKVGETKDIRVSLSADAPERLIERTFTWKNSNKDSVQLDIDPGTSAKATVTGLKPGIVTVTATNDYNPRLERSFTIKVIEYDPANMYMWQYSPDDRAQFGYEKDVAPQGTANGIANLNCLDWEYHRSNLVSVSTYEGAVKFGNSDDPEKNIKLVNKNLRKVDKIIIETASAYGLSNIIVKVGDNEVMNRATPASNTGIEAIETADLEALTGDISIEYQTEKSKEEDLHKSGGVSLKSIIIYYEPEIITYKTEKTYDLVTKYRKGAEDPDFSQLTGSGKNIIIGDEDFSITFNNIQQSEKDRTTYAKTNGAIDIVSKKSDEVIKEVEFEFENLTKVNAYSLKTSITAGENFGNQVAIAENGKIHSVLFIEHVNGIRLDPKTTNYIGLKTIKIKTVEGTHAVVDSIKYPDDSVPDRLEYVAGERFDPTGLPDLKVKFTDTSIDPISVSNDCVKFYDALSYDDPADHSGKTEQLAVGTTEVVGVFGGKEVRINGLTVTISYLDITLVKDAQDLVSGAKYMISIPSVKGYWKGSLAAAGMKGVDGVGTYDVEEMEDILTVDSRIFANAFTITASGDKFTIETEDSRKIGITASNSISIAAKPAISEWTISIVEGVAIFSIENGDVVKFLTYNSADKMNVESEVHETLALYRLPSIVK